MVYDIIWTAPKHWGSMISWRLSMCIISASVFTIIYNLSAYTAENGKRTNVFFIISSRASSISIYYMTLQCRTLTYMYYLCWTSIERTVFSVVMTIWAYTENNSFLDKNATKTEVLDWLHRAITMVALVKHLVSSDALLSLKWQFSWFRVCWTMDIMTRTEICVRHKIFFKNKCNSIIHGDPRFST